MRLVPPRWVRIALAVPAIVTPVAVFAFIVRTELAHDPETCPFREVERREIGARLSVAEERRSCLEGVEEHRYLVYRPQRRFVLGRRRFAAEAFSAQVYRWRANTDAEGRVLVTVTNEGHPSAQFREAPLGPVPD